jgi:para-nitrobenzyl esterase
MSRSLKFFRASIIGQLAWLVLICLSVNLMAQEDTFRHPPAGPVSGLVDESGALSWRGIPFAQPPLGELRWKAPRPAAAWTKRLEADHDRNICPQLGSPMNGTDPAGFGRPVGSEDCLYLNIWAPPEAVQAEAGLPVMVWVHGGSNVGGSGQFYRGGFLAQSEKVLVVTINYRLGVLGWFSHPAVRDAAGSELDRSANFGTLDIIRALQWLRENISAFGGDRDNVTVFGESAGAMNILTLLYAPGAKGLFHKAIMQSGSIRQTPVEVAEQHSADDRSDFSSTETAAKLLLARGAVDDLDLARSQVAGLSNEAFLELMRGATGEELIATYSPDIALRIRAPQIIPDGVVIPLGSPWALLEDPARVRNIPIMIGSNRDEMKFFLGLDPGYVKIVPGEAIIIHDPQKYNLHAGYLSDRWTAMGVDEIALRLSAHNPEVYAYRFDWDEQPSYPQADFKDFFGAAHTMELPFVFSDFGGYPLFAMHFTEQNGPGRTGLADAMGSYWANFAYTGKPGKGRSGKYPEWQAWGNGNKQILDAESDQGIQSRRESLTMNALHERFQADESFGTPEEKELFYQVLFEGREAWSEEIPVGRSAPD